MDDLKANSTDFCSYSDEANKRNSGNSLLGIKEKDEETRIQLEKCRSLLKELRNRKIHHSYTWVFKEPVDTIEMDCSDYYDVIKNPMDLMTMQGKMDRGEYHTPEEFAKDIRLIISNCKLYNKPGHVILKQCKLFEDVFDNAYGKIVNPIKTRSFLRKNPTIPNDKAYVLKELAFLKDYEMKLLDKLKSIIEEEKLINDAEKECDVVRKSKPKTPRPESKEISKDKKKVTFMKSEQEKILKSNLSDEEMLEPLTYDEKREIVRNITNLPDANIKEISAMIKKLEPDVHKSNLNQSITLDFSKCSSKTLREIEKYLYNFNHPKLPPADRFPRMEKLKNNQKLVMEVKKKLDNQEKACLDKMAMVQDQIDALFRSKVKPTVKSDSQQPNSNDSSDSETSSGSSSSDTLSSTSDDSEK